MNRKIIIAAGALSVLVGLTSAAPRAMAQQAQPAQAGEAAEPAAAPGSAIDALIAEADPGQGRQIAKICGNCHSFQLGAGHKIGPNLYGVAGRRIAIAPGYPFSPSLLGKVTETWTNENLDAFLTKPKDWVPGTKMTFPGLPNERERAAVIAYLRALPDQPLAEGETQAAGGDPAQTTGDGTKRDEIQRFVREGLVVDFSVTPVADEQTQLRAGDHVEVAFRISDEATGEPVGGLFPGAWMDIGSPWGRDPDPDKSCRDRVGLYLSGNVGFKPLIDLNSYYLLSLNEDPTITVIDPFHDVGGLTSLFALVNLEQPGADWARSADHKRFFVSMPRADQIAVVDTDIFKVKANVDAGVHPVRVALQPDEKYLWVGNDSMNPGESGVTVIDVETLKIAAQIPTGEGHHEIAFSDDSRTAFVSNRNGGTVSVIDVQSLQKVKDIETGSLPISVAYSPLSQALYVADGIDGVISVIDGRSHDIVTTIQTMAGLGPMRFDPSGRWGLVPNSEQDLVHVIDASVNRIAQEVSVGTRPFQVTFSRAFAYVRSLGTERVSMFALEDLNKGRKAAVVSFPAGRKAPELTPELNLADVIVEAPGEAAVMVSSPADATVYFYMEGMNAPMGNFRNHGFRPLAVSVVDRALREQEPGVYTSTVRLPEAGTYEVTFTMDSPQILNCFSVTAAPNPLIQEDVEGLAIEYLAEIKRAPAGEEFVLPFLLTDPRTGQLRGGLQDVRVLFYRAPSFERMEVVAKEVGPGQYEARLPIRNHGLHYVYVASRSAEVSYGDLPFLTLMGLPRKASAQKTENSGG
jgi:YVTN family beta-propeller protein